MPIIERHFEGNPTVFVVEDDKYHLDYLRYLLKKMDMNVIACQSAEEATTFINHFSIDIAILDINLGSGNNGITLMKQLRSNRLMQNKPIISITAYAHYRNKLITEGFNDFIQKPYDYYNLAGIIHRHLPIPVLA
jgi:two-component system cell cycle response regulator DivK